MAFILYNGSMEVEQRTNPGPATPSRTPSGTVQLTEAGFQAIVSADVEMTTLEAICLTLAAARSESRLSGSNVRIIDLYTLVSRHHEAYRFIDIKYVAQAVSELADRGYVRYVAPPVANTANMPGAAQGRLSRAQWRRQQRESAARTGGAR